MARRNHPRFDRRIPVSFHDGATDRIAFTTDVSLGGLFISATPGSRRPGDLIVVHAGVGREELRLVGRVCWTRMLPPRLRATSKGGLGVQLTETPTAWVRFIDDVATRALVMTKAR